MTRTGFKTAGDCPPFAQSSEQNGDCPLLPCGFETASSDDDGKESGNVGITSHGSWNSSVDVGEGRKFRRPVDESPLLPMGTHVFVAIDATERQLHIGRRNAVEILLLSQADQFVVGKLKDF